MDVVVHSFTAAPDRVETGGGATVSWNLTVPDTGEDFELRLNGLTIGAFGHRSFSNLTQTTDFALSVVTADGERVLLKRTVIVDPPECRWATPLDAFLITQPLKFQFDTRFSGSSQFRLRGDGTVVTLGDGAINIAVPIAIKVENWFDADMDVAIELSVTGGGGSRVIVLSRGVSLDVNWSFFENLLSLGCTSLVEDGMSKLGQVLMSDIVQSELVPKVAQALNNYVDRFISEVQAADPLHRTFVLAVLALSSEGLRFKVCPT